MCVVFVFAAAPAYASRDNPDCGRLEHHQLDTIEFSVTTANDTQTQVSVTLSSEVTTILVSVYQLQLFLLMVLIADKCFANLDRTGQHIEDGFH